MHEGHFTEQIVGHILRELAQYPHSRLKSAKVRVGEVFHLVPESVLMHYELATRGSPLEGSRLILIEELLIVACSQCGKEGPVEDHHLLMCPYCSSRQVKTVAGDQITVEEVELEQ